MANGKLPEALERFQDERMARNELLVRHAIDQMALEGQQVSFRDVAKRTGIGKSTLYRNRRLREIVEKARDREEPQQGTDAILSRLSELEREVAVLRRASVRGPSIFYAEVRLSPTAPKKSKMGRAGQ